MIKHERREIHYTGWVQGVGFRYTTREIAESFDVTGYVENLPDGRVRLVAEGDPAELDRFFEAVSQRLDRYIAAADAKARPATGEFDAFSIRH